MEPILSVKNLHTWFYMEEGVVKAVNDVSFDLYEDEVVGIVGETGSGKSVTVKSIMRLIHKPGKIVSGEIIYRGRGKEEDILKLSRDEMSKIRGKEISMIFQDPLTSLNPLYTIGDQLTETIVRHQDVDRKTAWEIGIEMLRKVQIPEPEKRMFAYPFEFSGGMRQRAIIAIALSCNPKVLIADEPTTALDVTIQAQILELMKELQKEFRTGLLFITHDLGVIASMADRIIVMYGSRQMEIASAEDIFYKPFHPYTHMLLRAIPRLDKKQDKLEAIPGQPPRMIDVPNVCPFAPRCPRRLDKCSKELPELTEIEPGHFVRCFNPVLDKKESEAMKNE
ncbi:peptide ABC transporter ATPase [Thermosipho melanesiensis]|uniref:Oligopeptide/dipeptide ABC transporter, ATPase subunit n=2 Tax=Thermosipho melanesiensis TaxID=46541 RepID=A6LMT0_THEM4|nr:ABC transporter ATP-binding protein [Thermosipho melanesiensis]ABR31231.1 oligopeptide/dipeptide ABC transporter, ATPase subunit [Thermosipho melanesiensis BI429]APT74315.1 peptide ABC transporter ATPase [Thermosipho melanesiensis]OOC36256.1 peptide ABC transporter ATPase [Thermosipho melanesiensis]OOC37074.1 peptide ABC transporter ATPase [Thermosipho melanesiensis]OOC37826.1 peptide ABC transporter ATPase [Thermosipho melanesiensis]